MKLYIEKEDIIQIIDNGLGFDINEPIRDGAVGISNVKFRLEHMIGGKIDMESVREKELP